MPVDPCLVARGLVGLSDQFRVEWWAYTKW